MRRAELLRPNVGDVQQREGRWGIRDMLGNRIRIVPVAVKARFAEWLAAARTGCGKIFRPVNRRRSGDPVIGSGEADEKAVWQLVLTYARETRLASFRRTLCGGPA